MVLLINRKCVSLTKITKIHAGCFLSVRLKLSKIKENLFFLVQFNSRTTQQLPQRSQLTPDERANPYIRINNNAGLISEHIHYCTFPDAHSHTLGGSLHPSSHNQQTLLVVWQTTLRVFALVSPPGLIKSVRPMAQ